jgi:uncharacterized protein YbcI
MLSESESAPSAEHVLSGTTLSAVSDVLVHLHKQLCGRGPTNARCFASGNAIVCILQGGLTQGEQALLDAGQDAEALAHRRALYEILKPRAAAQISELLGRRVTAMTMAADPANRLETAVFLLEEDGRP